MEQQVQLLSSKAFGAGVGPLDGDELGERFPDGADVPPQQPPVTAASAPVATTPAAQPSVPQPADTAKAEATPAAEEVTRANIVSRCACVCDARALDKDKP